MLLERARIRPRPPLVERLDVAVQANGERLDAQPLIGPDDGCLPFADGAREPADLLITEKRAGRLLSDRERLRAVEGRMRAARRC